MALLNRDIAALFDQFADLLEIDGANSFRVRAYRNASRVVADLSEELSSRIERDEPLTGIDGIGKDLAARIEGMVRDGSLAALDEMHERIPPTVHDLLALPGLGPKKAKVVIDALGITTLEGLEEAAKDGRLQALPGMGTKSVEKLVRAIAHRRETGKRFLRANIEPVVHELVTTLEAAQPGVEVVVAGSYRRRQETVGDIDLLAASGDASALMNALVSDPAVRDVLAHGDTKSSVVLRNGLQVDLRVVPDASFGAALHYFTGSRAHNVSVRRRAQKQGVRLNEYGLFRGQESIAGETEQAVFEALGLAWIPPELREDRGEIEAAESGSLPALLERGDLRGDLHTHTTASDGRATLEEMAAAARTAGLEYLAVTDHSKNLAIAGGLDEDRLLRQIDEIDVVNARLDGFRLLKGIEVDILEDGSLDLADDVLGRLDLVVGSVHSHFGLSREAQTTRVLRAMDHRHFTLLGHGTGRINLGRKPYDLEVTKVLEGARDRGCFVELNANPLRLDLNDIYCRQACDLGVLVSINSDAHRARDFANLSHGVDQARRAWLCKDDVLNTRPLDELTARIEQTMR